jgi:hypothetical protein
MKTRLVPQMLFLISSTLPFTATTTTTTTVGNATSVSTTPEPIEYKHCTIDRLFCLPANYSK